LDFNRRCAERARVYGAAETIANAELNLGDIFLAQGDLSLAHELLDGVHRLVQDPATSPWNRFRYATHLFASLGEFWLARGDLDQAQAFANQSLAGATRINARRHITKGLRLKGDIALARRQWDEAEGWLQQALPLAQAVGNPTQIWKTHLALERLHSAAKRPEQASQAHHAACQVIDQIKANIQNPTLHASLQQSSLANHSSLQIL
jgi:tetratricopeptide (TPR) repeat protein